MNSLAHHLNGRKQSTILLIEDMKHENRFRHNNATACLQQ